MTVTDRGLERIGARTGNDPNRSHLATHADRLAHHDLVECGTRAEARRRGLERLEGKDYVVADGDVLNIRFNV